MIETAEIISLDTRYERLRLRDRRREQILLSSILEQGILDPLYVINSADSSHILLDGFKRYRCAAKLSIPEVPVTALDSSEAMGILKLLRLSTSKSMNSLEEAVLVDELHQRHGMSTAEISRRLERSASWVSVRLGMLAEMSASTREKIFSGRFPLRSYMYTLKPFTRVNTEGSKKDVESFIECVSGKQLSTRDIDVLAGAWFKGGQMLKTQIKQGNLDWTLRQLKNQTPEPDVLRNNLSEAETRVLSNLEIAMSYILKISHGLNDAGLGNKEFFTLSRGAAGRLLNMLSDFNHTLQEFYDRCGQKTGCVDAVPGGKV